jgi:glycosyltransferase involved in cell wall biosynthesis
METKRLLAATKPSRKNLPKNLQKLHIVGFGTDDDYRRNGVWAAFRGLTDFYLFEVPDSGYPGCKTVASARLAKERDFLQFIKQREEDKPVHIAIFSHSGRHISDGLLDELQRKKIWSIVMSGDDQLQFFSECDSDGRPHQLRVAAKADLYWTSWSLGIRIVNALGGNAWFSPPGGNPDMFRSIPCAKDLEIVFVGSCFGVRKEIIKELMRYFSVATFGFGWPNGPVSFDETIQIFNRAKIVLGIGGVGTSLAVQMLKGRDFEVPMCGATYVTSSYSELSECFDVGREVVCYSSIEDCVEAIARLLADPRRCAMIGAAARERCIRDHTWDQRVRSLLGLWN